MPGLVPGIHALFFVYYLHLSVEEAAAPKALLDYLKLAEVAEVIKAKGMRGGVGDVVQIGKA